MPHSEICGSKVAHTSPQLIAACHVLHRLCMPRHPPNALTSRLKTRTTNDNTDVSPTALRLSNDFFCFHCIGAYGEKYYPRYPMPISTASFKKNPFTMSKTNRWPNAKRPGYRRRNMCDGKLVTYILEGSVRKRVVEPIGIEPMT